MGTLEPRKNLDMLLEAWREMRRHHAVDLVLAGRRRADAPEIRPEPGLRLAGEVADAELPALYSGALAFVYPSLYEGFGLPVLEAMQCGAPVIASRAVEEAAGDAAIYADTPRELARRDGGVGVAPRTRGRGAPAFPGARARILLGTHRPPHPSGLRGGTSPLWSLE